jgi:hypothetical protein
MNPLDLPLNLSGSALTGMLVGLLWWSIVAVLVLLAAELVCLLGLTVRAIRGSRLTVSSRIRHPNVTARL